jgi:hypothetical protein
MYRLRRLFSSSHYLPTPTQVGQPLLAFNDRFCGMLRPFIIVSIGQLIVEQYRLAHFWFHLEQIGCVSIEPPGKGCFSTFHAFFIEIEKDRGEARCLSLLETWNSKVLRTYTRQQDIMVVQCICCCFMNAQPA